MKNIIVRTAKTKDVNCISNIEERCFPDKQKFGKSIIFALLYMSPKYMSFSALIGKEIVGYIIGEIDDNEPQLARIVSIAVKKDSRRRGIGKSLLKTLEKHIIDEYNIQQIQLQVHTNNQTAIKFYEANDYKVLKELRNYYGRKENAFLMGKEVK